MKNFILLSFISFFSARCLGQQNETINLDSLSVRQYVELLKLTERKVHTIHILTIGKTADVDWIKKSDIPYLMELIGSNEDANCVWQSISSQLPLPNESTLGGQVMNLIDAYRQGKNYPYFLTSCAKTDVERVQEIRNWWEDLQ